MMFDAMPPDEKEHAIAAVVPPRYLEARLEHLPTKLQEIIKMLPENMGLLLWGVPGVGKSYSLAALARQYISQGFTAARIGYELLCLQLRDTFKSRGSETELSVIKPYLQADKLFIEDIGTTKSEGNVESDFSVRTLLVLLDWRLENCLATFVTTNRPVEELAKTFDERIASRLCQACEVLKLTGEDRRVKKQKVTMQNGT
jgi:DNA replication protein DnaC